MYINLDIDRPKYISVQKEGKFIHLFLEPGSTLNISKEKDRYVIKGDLKGENTYLQDIENNKELLEKAWDYSVPFDQFKQQVDIYFRFKGKLLDKNVNPTHTDYFYQLSKLENRAYHNSILLDYIRTKAPVEKKDSLFFNYFDVDLLDAKYTEDYLESDYLRSFYSNKGVAYFMKKKYGKNLHSVSKQEEYYVLRNDIISEYFDQPLKSILIYDNLAYYPEDYDAVSDSMKLTLTPPRAILSRYKKDLNDSAHSALMKNLDNYEFKKKRYAKGAPVPKFLLKDTSNSNYELNTTDFDKLILIDVWASWCGPCIKNFPKVKALKKQYPSELEVIPISIDHTYDLYKEGLDKYEVPGKIQLYAENGFTSNFAKHFQVTAIPRYILISPMGKILEADLNLADFENYL